MLVKCLLVNGMEEETRSKPWNGENGYAIEMCYYYRSSSLLLYEDKTVYSRQQRAFRWNFFQAAAVAQRAKKRLSYIGTSERASACAVFTTCILFVPFEWSVWGGVLILTS